MRDITTRSAPTADYSEIRSGWRLLLSAMLGTGLGLPSLPFYSIGIFAPVFAREFHWSYASIMGGLVLTTGVLLFGGPVIGWIVDRFGARRVASISLALLGLSFMTLALSSGSIIQYYLSWLAISLTGMGATPVTFTRAINRTFTARRGLALGITLAGTGLFVFAVKPLAQHVLHGAGWRAAVVTIGLLPLVIGVPAVLWGFSRQNAEAVTRASATPNARNSGLTFRQALRTRAFWLLAAACLPISFAGAAPFPNLETILRSVQLDPGQIVQVTALVGITIILGRLVGGWLMDQIWAPLVGAFILTAAAVGCVILSQMRVSFGEAAIAVMLLGFAAGVELDLISFLVARYIGVRSYGMVYATIYGLFAVGAGSGPGLFGYAYDRLGSFSLIMAFCAALLLVSSCLLLALGRYPLAEADSATAPVESLHRFGAEA